MQRAYLVLLILISCSDEPKSLPSSDIRAGKYEIWPPSVPFPSQKFSKVALYYMDSIRYENTNLGEMETKVMNAPYTNGLAFIDSMGRPVTRFCEKRILSAEELQELNFILQVNPQSVTMTSCIPFYRDVFIFYQGNHQVAQAQVCFECSQTFLTPRSSARFDERNWQRLKLFVAKVKAR